jgi:hypothetical protein
MFHSENLNCLKLCVPSPGWGCLNMCLMLVRNRNCVTTAFKVPSIDRTNGLKKLLQWRLYMYWLFSYSLPLTCHGTVELLGFSFCLLCLWRDYFLLGCDTVVIWKPAYGRSRCLRSIVACLSGYVPPSCADYLEILGASTSWSSKGLFRPIIMEELNFYLYLLTPTAPPGYKTTFPRRQ